MKVEVDHLQNLHGHTEVGHGGEAQVHSWLVAEAGFFFFFCMF